MRLIRSSDRNHNIFLIQLQFYLQVLKSLLLPPSREIASSFALSVCAVFEGLFGTAPSYNIHLEQRARLVLNAVVTVSRSVLEHLVESIDDVMMLDAANCSFERTNDACVLRL